MPLSDKQRAALTAEAKRRGVDPDKLIAAAEKSSGGTKPMSKAAPSTEPPKLFMYHLPFVTVREVRQNWLGLSDSFPGDSSIASEWAAKHGAAPSSDDGSGQPPPVAA